MPSVAERLKVLLADDHILVREGLKAVLQQAGYDVVGEASDGRAAAKLCEVLQPDVAVLDIAMPLLNGIDAGRDIMRACPNTKVVLLTMYKEECYVLAGLRAGISGYVLKSGAASNLVQAIEAVRGGEVYMSPGVSRTVVQAYLANAQTPPDPLSLREREVLQLIAEGCNMKEIGSHLGISERTAETHRARIMGKLGIRELAGLVRYAIQHRLVDVPPAAVLTNVASDSPVRPPAAVTALRLAVPAGRSAFAARVLSEHTDDGTQG